MRGARVERDDVKHGTLAGYRWHKNEGEDPCRPCRLAWNKYHVLYAADEAKRKKLRKKDVTGR